MLANIKIKTYFCCTKTNNSERIMKETVRELNKIWRVMLYSAIAAQAFIGTTLLYIGEWALALLAFTVVGMLCVLHRNRVILYDVISQWCNAAVESDYREMDKNIRLRHRVEGYDLVTKILLKGLYDNNPVSAKEIAHSVFHLLIGHCVPLREEDIVSIAQEANNCTTYEDTISLITKINNLADGDERR